MLLLKLFNEELETRENKEYERDLFKYINENTELKKNAEKDEETLADTISINQVLTEEIKVKDQIIKANEMINSNTNTY